MAPSLAPCLSTPRPAPNSIAFHPSNSSIIYIGAAGGGVWKTTNAGVQWQVLTDSLTAVTTGGLAVDPNNPNVVYYGTGELNFSLDSYYGDGLFKSTNGGTTWTKVATTAVGRYFSQITINPLNTNISHNLAVVEHISHRIAVMYLGRIVEYTDKRTLFTRALHPYTEQLLLAVPVPDPRVKRPKRVLQGDVPSPINPPPGCHFHTRCPYAVERCRVEVPALREVKPGQMVSISGDVQLKKWVVELLVRGLQKSFLIQPT